MHRNFGYLLVALVAAGFSACGGRLGDLGPNIVIKPPILPPPAAPQVGLVAMAPGNAEVRVDYVLPSAGFEACLFLEASLPAMFTNPPLLEGLTGDHLILSAVDHPTLIVNGEQVFAGFGIRPVGGTDWRPIGAPIRARPSAQPLFVPSANPLAGSTFFVDPAATIPVGPTGTEQPTVFHELDLALQLAAGFTFFGPVNVLVAEGTYETHALDQQGIGGAFLVAPNVQVYGGFKPGFSLATRQAVASATVLHGGPNGATTRIVDIISGGPVHVFDGFTVDGRDATTEGIDIVESDCELRSVVAKNCVDNGMRIKQLTDFQNRRNVSVVACDVSSNGNDGLGLIGNFNVVFDRSTFDANGGAGIDINDLLALEGASASVTAFGCRFFGNSLEGLGMDLNTIITSNDEPGGFYIIDVEGCSFERNGTVGLRIDEDHDNFPAWHTTVRVRDCVARANRLEGIHLDADDQGDYVLDRVRCTANGADGISVTSELNDPTTVFDDLAPGHIAITNSYCGGNLGIGMHAWQGDKVLLVSHSVLAANRLGGIVSETSYITGANPRRISSAASCVFWKQPTPFTNVVQKACWLEDVDNPFANCAELFATATANLVLPAAPPAQDLSQLTLTGPSLFDTGMTAVVGDDGVAREVLGADATTVTIRPAVENQQTFIPPDVVFGYTTATIVDDLRLLLSSPAVGTALVPQGDTARDPGPGGSIGGGEPGVFNAFAPKVLHLLQTSPPIATGVTPTTPLVLTFDLPIDPASVTPDRVRIDGVPDIGLTVSGSQVTVSPPPAGWGGGDVLELNIGIAADDGTPFGTALLIPILIR